MKIMKNTDKIKNVKRMYGYDMKEPSDSFVASDLNSAKEIGKLEIIGIKIEKNKDGFDLVKIQYNDGGRIKESIEESLFQRTDEELKQENILFSTYKEIERLNHVKEIKCSDFLEEIKERFKNDVRYGYKGIYLETNKNSRHRVYIYRIYAIIIAALSIYNDIDFKHSVKISLMKEESCLTLEINMNLDDKKLTANIFANSYNEARTIYLRALCKNRGSFALIGRKFSLTYYIDELPKDDKFKLYSKESEENLFFNKYMNIFNPNGIETEAEEEL